MSERINNILKLINNNGWGKINTMLKDTTLDPLKIIANGNNILHMASINNNTKIIKYVLDNNTSSLKIGNIDGNTPLHIAGQYKYDDLIKIILKRDPNLASLLNNNGENILFLVNDNPSLFKWIIKNTDIKLDNIDNNGNTLLLLNIAKSNNNSDKYFRNIKLLVDNGVSINIPNKIPPLSYASHMGKSHIVTYFMTIKNKGIDVDINIKDRKYLTPLIRAVHNSNYDIAKILVKNGADINYSGPEGDNNQMIRAVQTGNDKVVMFYLNNNYDTSIHNRDLNTALHIALNNNKLSTDTLFRLIYKSDLNKKNINGVTSLHILLNNYNWGNFTTLLQSKKLDIFSINNKNKMPIDYIKDKDLPDFMDLIAVNYSKKYNKLYTTGEHELERCCKNQERCGKKYIESNKCKDIIKELILKNKRSYPKLEDKNKLSKLKFIEGSEIDRGVFNSDSIHNIVYTILILKKHKQLGIPYRHYIDTIATSEKINSSINLFRDSYGKLISDVIQGYTDFVYEITPYLIMWRNSSINYINKDLEYYLLKCLHNDKIRFIMFKLTLVASTQGTHANIILFDKKTGIMDRFDPYGHLPYLSSHDMDKFLENKFKKMLKWYINKNNLKFQYLSPKDFMGSVSFQTISDDSNSVVKKLGDPIGYCLAWVFWYVDMRLNNPDIHPKDIIEISIDEIIKFGKGRKSNNIFIDFIRNYAGELDNMKNNFFIKAGVDKRRLYNLVLNDEEDNMISKYTIKVFNKIIKN